MPLDLRGFMDEPNQFAGLSHIADQIEKRKLRQDQLALQKESKRNASATFLQNYLDPKDMLTGTDYDPVMLKGLESLKQQGARLIAAGADNATLMTALGPAVNKLTTYSTNAKNVNKKIDEEIEGMRKSGIDGYNWGALKEEALKNAFYKQDANGQMQLDPENIDLNQHHVANAIQNNPLAVTNNDVFDEFAKKAEKIKTKSDVTTYTPLGTKFRSTAHLISPAYMVPELDKEGVMTGFVPKHDIATEQGQPLYHTFDKGGKQVREPVRLLDEDFYDKGLKRAMQDRIRGMVQQHLNEYSDKTGKQISIDSPEAKRVGRAIAYDMLNVASRSGGTIEHIDNKGQPSTAMINLRVNQTPEALENVRDRSAAAKQGRLDVTDPNDMKPFKRNMIEALGEVFNGTEDLSEIKPDKLNGPVFTPDGKKHEYKDREVINITGSMPGAGIKSGLGANYQFNGVYYDPKARSLIVEQEEGPSGNKTTKTTEIPEANVGQFIYRHAEANGIPKLAVKRFLEQVGYSGGKFRNYKQPTPTAPPTDPNAADFNKREKSWRVSLNKGTKAAMNPFGKPANLQ